VKVERHVVGPFQENCYLLLDEDTSRAVLIDPGDEGDALVAAVAATGATLDAIWLTHAHLDHVGGVAAILRQWPVPVYLHAADLPLLELAPRSAVAYGVPFEPPPPPDHSLAEGDRLSCGALSFDVFHAPGHAPGHVVIHGHGVAFVGDCLFAGSIGRTDLPLADGRQLEQALVRIAALPGPTVVYPGHGDATTIAEERASNPFLTGVARPLRR
jgi:hydroxyacylglutathione hydrolase